MKLETKILWLISLILIISSCDTINTNSRNSKANNVGTSTIITHPPSVDSLLKGTNKNQSMIKNVGSLLNLQLLRGYRGIMLGMPYDSLSFQDEDNVNKKYESRGIVIVNQIKAYMPLFRTPCEVDLTFFKDSLVNFAFNFSYGMDMTDISQIESFSEYKTQNNDANPLLDRILSWNTPQCSYDIIGPKDDLLKMFGQPNVVHSSFVYDKKDNSLKAYNFLLSICLVIVVINSSKKISWKMNDKE